MRFDNEIVVDSNGVGYEILVSNPSSYELGSLSIVYVYHHVREDEQYLIGFKTFKEREIFLKLIAVHGIGPKTAMNALSATTPDSFLQAIEGNNILFLKKLPGIGPKAASQILLDLKGKLAFTKTSNTGNKELDDALTALKQFGFKNEEILNVLKTIDDQNLKAEQYILIALKKLRKDKYE